MVGYLCLFAVLSSHQLVSLVIKTSEFKTAVEKVGVVFDKF